LRWVRETQPQTFARVARWLSLGELIVLRLTGTTAVGTSTAAWTGLLDRLRGTWDEGMLAVAGIHAESLSPIHHPDQPLTGVTTRWPALAGAAWFPVVTDGLAANIGTGASDAQTMVASFATSGAVRVR